MLFPALLAGLNLKLKPHLVVSVVAQFSRAFAILTKVLGLVSSICIQTTICNSSYRGSNRLLYPLQAPVTYVIHIYA